ncbi:MAG: helix-turn-helix domain-containing protein [Pseudonocardiaceae bacterium]
MAGGSGPTVRARRLRRELKRLRNNAGLNVDDAGRQAGMSGPTISRIESGKRGMTVDEVEKLLDTYQVPVPQQREYLEMAERAADRGWWQAYGSALTDATQTQIALEEDATTITNFEPVVVPGLLQTAAYARAVISTVGLDVTPRQVEAMVAARMARQAILTRPDPPQLITVLDEGVLHREVGGRAVMARQLRQLIEAATSQPNVTVQVIPFTAGAHAAVEGSFAVIEFGMEPGAVLLEGKTADLFLEEPDEIATYQDIASRLQQSALEADDTVALIEQMLREMT